MLDILIKKSDIFWSKVTKSGKDDCWLWCGYKAKTGYGRYTLKINKKPKTYSSHKLAFILWNKIIPDASVHVGHRCNNKQCCNPHHLYLCTPKQNTLDAIKDGLRVYKAGEDNQNAKLNVEVVKLIKIDRLSGMTYRSLAKKYKIAHSNLWNLLNGVSYKTTKNTGFLNVYGQTDNRPLKVIN